MVSSLCDLQARLDSRKKVSPALFADNMKIREETHHLGIWTLLRCRSFDLYWKNFYAVIFLRLCSKLHPSGLCGWPVPGHVVPHAGGRETSQTVCQVLSERRWTSGGRSGPFQHYIGGMPHIISQFSLMHMQILCLMFLSPSPSAYSQPAKEDAPYPNYHSWYWGGRH